MNTCLIRLVGIEKFYTVGSRRIPVIQGIDLIVEQGDYVAIMGPSGAGKSTLLHILGCMDSPSAGVYLLDNLNVSEMSDTALSRLRATSIGFVFQTFHLIATLNTLENVELPFLYAKIDSRIARSQAMEALRQVGLEHRLHHRPAELSGGEMQRAAIARAVAIKPKIILADEPTGNLDSETGKEVLKLFRQVNQTGVTILLITHDREVAAHANTLIRMKDGKIVSS